MSGSSFSSVLDWYHSFTNSLMAGIFVLVVLLIFYLFYEKQFFKLNGSMYVSVEVACVVVPSVLVTILVYYSLYMLYSLSVLDVFSALSLKVISSQWYWSYEVAGTSQECILTPLEELSPTSLLRNFSTTPVLVLPQGASVRGCMTSTDVIHSWSIPSMGVKSDCNPGLLTTLTFKPHLVGSFHGGCAEICGVGHSMMPIHVEIITPNLFLNYF